jgi:hypothetical protein
MKTTFKTIALAIALTASFAFNTYAEDKETKKVTGFGTGIFVAKNHKVFVSVDKYNDSNAIVILSDHQGNAIYREVFNKKVNKFRKVLDINALPVGDYTIEVFSNGEKVTKSIEVTEKRAQREISLK